MAYMCKSDKTYNDNTSYLKKLNSIKCKLHHAGFQNNIYLV
jgi:hypothetical protein